MIRIPFFALAFVALALVLMPLQWVGLAFELRLQELT
jgi:hypothetical protein